MAKGDLCPLALIVVLNNFRIFSSSPNYQLLSYREPGFVVGACVHLYAALLRSSPLCVVIKLQADTRPFRSQFLEGPFIC